MLQTAVLQAAGCRITGSQIPAESVCHVNMVVTTPSILFPLYACVGDARVRSPACRRTIEIEPHIGTQSVQHTSVQHPLAHCVGVAISLGWDETVTETQLN